MQILMKLCGISPAEADHAEPDPHRRFGRQSPKKARLLIDVKGTQPAPDRSQAGTSDGQSADQGRPEGV